MTCVALARVILRKGILNKSPRCSQQFAQQKHDWIAPEEWDLTQATTKQTKAKWDYYNRVVWPANYQLKGKAKIPEVFHMKADVRHSPDKLWFVCQMVRGLPVDEGIKQLSFVTKKAALILKEVLLEAQDKGIREHNIEYKSNLWIAEAYATLSFMIKSQRRHTRGRFATVRHRFANVFVRLEEGPPPAYRSRDAPRDGWTEMNEYVQWLRSKRIELGW